MAALSCRNDALVIELNARGYNPILMPRTGAVPPEIYLYDIDTQSLTRWGRLGACVPPGALPSTLNEGELPDLQHRATSKKGASAGGSFLKNGLACIGIDAAPKLDLSFAQGHDLTFSFTGTTFRGLDPADIGAAVAQFNPGAIPASQVAAGMVHIAYEYAYATSLLLSTADTVSAGIDFKALKIDHFIDLGGKATVAAVDKTTLSFTGHGAPAAFACKVGRLEKRGKRWDFYAIEVLGQGLTADEGGVDQPYLLYRGAVLQVTDLMKDVPSGDS